MLTSMCVGAVVLLSNAAKAQNLFAATGAYVAKYDSNGNLINQFFASGSGGIAFDTSGNLYVANFGGNANVLKYSPNGTPIPASFVSGVNQAEGLAIDSSGLASIWWTALG